jgi:hypothetical protein
MAVDLNSEELVAEIVVRVIMLERQLADHGLGCIADWKTKSPTADVSPDATRLSETVLFQDSETVRKFDIIADSLQTAGRELLRQMIQYVVLYAYIIGLDWVSCIGIGQTKAETAAVIVSIAVLGLPIDIRGTDTMWPTGQLFPLSDRECRAAMMGYQVRWRGDFEGMSEKIRHKWMPNKELAILL